MKDNRIIRPEQMTERDHEVMASVFKSYLEKQHQKELQREAELQRKIASGELIERNDKLYDTRYYKGE